MSRRARFTLALLAAVLSLSLVGDSRPPEASMSDTAVTGLIHEARMRKLHLVRPDLIAYPVSFDVVC